MSDKIRVLVVDDEPQILRALRINLKARGFDVTTAASGTGALTAAAQTNPQVVILDLGLPDIDGFEVLAGLRADGPMSRSSCCRRVAIPPRRCRHWTPAPTTM